MVINQSHYVWFYSLGGNAAVELYLNTLPGRGDIEFMRICILRALEEIEEKVMERVVIDGMTTAPGNLE